MKILHKKINPEGIPDFSDLRLCDYLDLPEINDGTTTYKWNGEYKNLRIIISAFNLYYNSKKTRQNHIVFTFRNIVLERKMDFCISYGNSLLAAYLDSDFKSGLKAVIGNYLYDVMRLNFKDGAWVWKQSTIFLPTELEVWGSNMFCNTHVSNEYQAQYPIYRDSVLYKLKRHNGIIYTWWLGSVCTLEKNSFCVCLGAHEYYYKYDVSLGVAPAFCIS